MGRRAVPAGHQVDVFGLDQDLHDVDVEGGSSNFVRAARDRRLRVAGRLVWMGPRDEADEERLAAAYLGGMG
jgi:hypothetical protein